MKPGRGHVLPATLFLGLFAFWLLLSDQYGALFVGMGVASAALVTWVMVPLVAGVVDRGGQPLHRLPVQLWRFAVYAAWLVGRIVVAGSQVAYVVVHPAMPIQPVELSFRAGLRSGLARVMLANTISLVPGTLTLRLEGDTYLVHALVPQAVDELLDGRMQRIVGRIFFEDTGPALDPQWLDAPEVRS